MKQQAASARGVFLVYISFVALCSFVILVAMYLSPSEPGRAVLFGLSPTRLFLAAGFLSVFIFFAVLFIRAARDREWAERTLEQWFGGGRFSKWLAWSAGIGLGLGWIGCFLPAYRAGILGPHWNRIQPIMVFILLSSIATLAVFLLKRSNFPIRGVKVSSTFRLSFVYFLASLSVLIWMLYSKYGIYSLEDFWYGAGVPILASQLIAAVLGGVLFVLLKGSWNSGRKDLVVFFLLYVGTAVLWAGEPLQKSFLFVGPHPPNHVLYPFADAAAFDAGSQFALIGQGIFAFNNPFFERSLYLSFLVYLHSLFGQNYEALMAGQAAVFAILPPLIYLIGRSLNLRPVGFASALVAMFRGINSIAASSLIDLANPKMMLTDFPAAIGVALIVLFTCEWLKRPQRSLHYALWIGGAIGLTLMLRTNALVFLLFIPLLAIFKLAPRWKIWLTGSILVFLAVVAFTLPWELRNLARGGIMYSSIATKIQDVIRTRYMPVPETESLSPLGEGLSVVTFRHASAISSLYQETGLVQEQSCNSILCFAPKHFLHNTITSILILPTSPIFDDLWHTVKETRLYWRAAWDGTLTPVSLVFLTVNLFIIVLGVAVAWKFQRLPGLVPLAVFVFYNLSNSFARTSGGRYIIPMDWITSFYFMAGILFLLTEAARATHVRQLSLLDPENEGESKVNHQGSPWLKAMLILILLFGAGSFIPLSEKLHSPRYAGFNIPQALQDRESQIMEAGLGPEQINEFLEKPGAEMLVGRTLYPRYYRIGQGEVSFYFYPYTIMDFPRTGFFLIGPNGQDGILLPGGAPAYLPHAADALVIGCRDQNYVDALMVIVLDDTGTVYTRSPMPELTCPMKQPVCRNNNNCQ
jgi:hypothetical protein